MFWHLFLLSAFGRLYLLRKDGYHGKTEITFILRPSSLHPKQYAEGFDCLHVSGLAGRGIRAVPDDKAFGGNFRMDSGILWAVRHFVLVHAERVSADTGRMALGIRWV